MFTESFPNGGSTRHIMLKFLCSLKDGDLVFKSHSKHGCLSAFIPCVVLSYVRSELATGDTRPRSPTGCPQDSNFRINSF
jgi:hypothetical protein